jgi:gluconate 2-dehydrogenase gamma chain
MKQNLRDNQNKNYVENNEAEWLLSRKAFVKSLVLSGIALQLPWLQSCATAQENFGDIHPLNLSQFKTCREIQNVLFPSDGNGPGAIEINSDKYLLWILRDPILDKKENDYFINNINQFTNECKAKYNDVFYELNGLQKSEFITSISKTNWGKPWLSRMLTLIFEALLLDPIYGGNTNKEGWKWLEHDPGSPRPTKTIMYPQILEKHGI